MSQVLKTPPDPGESIAVRSGSRANPWAVLGIIILGVLLFVGIQGRNEARLQARLVEILDLRRQLHQSLMAQRPPTVELLRRSGSAGNAPPMTPATRSGSTIEGLNRLQKELVQFERQYGKQPLKPRASLELRLVQATAANAEGDFPKALSILPDPESPPVTAGGGLPTDLKSEATLVRADSHLGLHQWKESLDLYRRLQELQPARVDLLRSVIECQFALGMKADAVSNCWILMKALESQAKVHLNRGRVGSALVDLAEAREITSQLASLGGSRDAVRDEVRILTTLSWIHSSAPDRSYRDATSSKAYALKACELSQDQSVEALEALAAAYAEARQLQEAVNTQKKAVDLATGDSKQRLQEALDHYVRAGNSSRP